MLSQFLGIILIVGTALMIAHTALKGLNEINQKPRQSA